MSGKIVTFANNKGGSGKSTTCVAFACYLCEGKRQRRKKRTLIIDTDKENFTTSSWINELELDVTTEQISDAKEIVEAIKTFSKQYDYVLVDCPANATEVTRMAMMYSDLVIMPVKPTPADLRAAITVVTIFKQMQRDGYPNGGIVLNQAKKGTKLLREAQQLLSGFASNGIHPFKQVVYSREVIADSHQKKSQVWNSRNKAAIDAADDYRNLFSEFFMLLKN